MEKNSNGALTEREREVLQLLSEGYSNKEVSDKLFISIQTVKTHVAHIFDKLEARDRTHAVAIALRERLLV
ncbi:MAG: response regulator transcription factor [Candidatus Geothermincolia bacterium]